MNPRVSFFIALTLIFISCSTEVKEALVVPVTESKTLISETDILVPSYIKLSCLGK